MTKSKFHPKTPLCFQVIVDLQRGNDRHFVEGMLRYAHEREPVEFMLTNNPASLGDCRKIQGFIYTGSEEPWLDCSQKLLETGKPAVALNNVSNPNVCRVICNDYAIGRVGFEHLHDLGLQHFAYFGLSIAEFSNRRLAGFREAAQKAGFEVALPPHEPIWNHDQEPEVRKWLKRLPKPVGLMTSVMERGERSVQLCHEANLIVPDQVAVLTIDDDELACQMVTPSLSTIDTGAKQIGYLAIELLAQMVRGERPKEKTIVVPPGELTIRQSTDMLAIDDPMLSSAVRFIRQHACEGIHVNDVLQHVPMSRRSLECAFKHALNRTVHDEILRVRLDKARRLLRSSELSLSQVSAKTAFASASDFCKIFRRETSLTPMAYRRKIRQR